MFFSDALLSLTPILSTGTGETVNMSSGGMTMSSGGMSSGGMSMSSGGMSMSSGGVSVVGAGDDDSSYFSGPAASLAL